MLSKDDTYRKIFANNLNYYMQLNGKIQDDLVKDLGLKSSTISSWCNGLKLPRMDKIILLSNYFGIHFSNLIEKRTTNKEINYIKIPLLSLFEKDYSYSLNNYFNKYLLMTDDIPENSFGLISGDSSMSPLLDIGDIAIIELNSTFISGKTYLLINHNIPIIRKVVKINDYYELQTFNPYYPSEKVTNINVIGKVIKSEINFK